MFRKCLLGCLLISSVLSANQMQQSFSEGMAVGKVNSGAAQNTSKGFNPSEIKGYQANPEQSKYYTGITGDDPNISALGMQELSNSELGKTIRESTINNPRDNISMDSDIIRNSEEIKKNANIISGNVAGKQCAKQVLSKSTFTNHFCEKDQTINHICINKANVVWTGTRKVEEKEYDFNINVSSQWYEWREKIKIPESGYIKGYSITIPYKGGGYYSDYSKNTIDVNFANKDFQLKMRSDRSLFGENTLIDKFKVNKDEYLVLSAKSHRWKFGFINALILRGKDINVKLYMEIEVDDLKAEIQWVNSCQNFNDDNLIKIGEKCTQAGGERNFFKDGKNIQLHSDCWETQTEYLVSEASDNECKKYDSNPNCTVGERECLDSIGEHCTRFRLKYQCQHTTRTEGVVCGDKFFCSDGSCSDLENSVNTDFGHAVSQLATLAQAGKDVAFNPNNLRAFSGKAMFCRKTGFGFSNCCKDSGWGHKAGLAQCNSEENALGKAKEKNLVIYTGTYCDKKVLGKCIRKKSSYCVFDNKLARIIQYQGRSGQLGIGFGGAQSPNCRGLSVEELQRIDFNAMDYSDFYDELNSNTKLPDQNQLIDYMKKTITDQLKQE